MLEIQLLGTFQIRCGSRVIPDDAWKLRKAAGIVKLLTLVPGHRLHREQVLDTLWPELEPDAAANNFRYALHTARQTLTSDRTEANQLLYREGAHLVLGSPEAVWVDVEAFEAALELAWRSDDPTAYQAAARLYAGDLLPADRYEEWLDGRRTTLRTGYLALLTRLAQLYQESDKREAAIETLQQLVGVEPTQEEAHAKLILLHARAGQREAALAQYERLVQVLDTELGVEPDSVIQQLIAAVREGSVSAASTQPDAPRRESHTNLPAQVTPIVGRERERAEIRQALSQARLVTLTGPGGVGKTRLALAAADDARASFGEGIFFVALAPVRHADLVATTIVHTLGVREATGKTPVETLSAYLSERSLLLVLDNFEHVVEGAAVVATLLETCPHLTILVTSRVPLRLRGEQEYPLPPLSIPDLDTAQDPEVLGRNDAVTLFLRRVQAVRPRFTLTVENSGAVAAICRRLDGLPLAIELAAVRMKVLSPQAILARLEHPLSLLTGGPHDLPDRQQTIRATIQWSFDLLKQEEQRLLRRLSVFTGGWTLEAAEAVAALDGDSALNILDGLAALVDNSLVARHEQPDGEIRFGMLETIREFGLEPLVESGESGAIMQRHASHFTDTSERAATHLETVHQGVWLSHMESDDGNVNSALQWCRQSGSAELGLRLVTALRLYWFIRGRLNEGYERSVEIVGLPQTTQYPEMRADALNTAGFFARSLGNQTHASELVMESLMLSRSLDDPARIANALANLGYISLEQEQYAQARVYYDESLTSYRQFGNKQGIADTLSHLAVVALQKGDLEPARTMNAESLALWEELGDREGIAWASYRLAIVRLRQGCGRDAYQPFTSCLTISMDIGFLWGIAWGLEGLARLAMEQNQPSLAARTLAAASHVRGKAGIPSPAYERHDIQAVLDRAKDALGAEAFDALWNDNQNLSPETALQDAARALVFNVASLGSVNDIE